MYAHVSKNEKSRRLKGRGVSNGRLQRDHLSYNKNDAAFSTVSIEAVLIKLVIDAHERQDVAILNIPGTYLHAKMKNYILMLLDGTLAKLMV